MTEPVSSRRQNKKGHQDMICPFVLDNGDCSKCFEWARDIVKPPENIQKLQDNETGIIYAVMYC